MRYLGIHYITLIYYLNFNPQTKIHWRQNFKKLAKIITILVVNYALQSSTKKSIVSHQKVVKGARERPEVRHNRNGAALLLKNTFVLYQSNSPQWGKKIWSRIMYNFLVQLFHCIFSQSLAFKISKGFGCITWNHTMG